MRVVVVLTEDRHSDYRKKDEIGKIAIIILYIQIGDLTVVVK